MTKTITVAAKGHVVVPKSMCARKRMRPGTCLRITEVGNGFYVSPVPEPSEAELAAIFESLDHRHSSRPQTMEDEAVIQAEIRSYRAKARRRKV